MRRLLLAITALGCTFGAIGGATAATDEKEEARAIIWAKEQAVYAGRAKGDMTPYITNAAPEYLGWPPYSRMPYGTAGIQMNEKSWAGENHERLTMEFKDFTLHQGHTALIYYNNHRTSLPDGSPVDQNWEIIHVWVKDKDEWRLLGACNAKAV